MYACIRNQQCTTINAMKCPNCPIAQSGYASVEAISDQKQQLKAQREEIVESHNQAIFNQLSQMRQEARDFIIDPRYAHHRKALHRYLQPLEELWRRASQQPIDINDLSEALSCAVNDSHLLLPLGNDYRFSYEQLYNEYMRTLAAIDNYYENLCVRALSSAIDVSMLVNRCSGQLPVTVSQPICQSSAYRESIIM